MHPSLKNPKIRKMAAGSGSEKTNNRIWRRNYICLGVICAVNSFHPADGMVDNVSGGGSMLTGGLRMRFLDWICAYGAEG
mmetsp:Transcript_21481/g.31807  ORF Transcript_21481/g.31807 Transcript_21481/m.31807 type:complete len:80 (-) Transcript_21481:180-419(-)